MKSLELIKKVISEIPDPEIPVISIKELGVLRNIFYEEDSLKVVITPTYSGCPAMDRFQKDIIEKLEVLKVTNYEIKMQLLFFFIRPRLVLVFFYNFSNRF